MSAHRKRNPDPARDEWATPPEVWEPLAEELGGFHLDPAARAATAKARYWYGPDHPQPWARDGLAVSWWFARCIWLNPPYSNIPAWLAKAREAQKGGALVVCLLPASTSTRWFHAHLWDGEQHRPRPGVELRFLPKRIKFLGAAHPAPFDSVVAVLRKVD